MSAPPPPPGGGPGDQSGQQGGYPPSTEAPREWSAGAPPSQPGPPGQPGYPPDPYGAAPPSSASNGLAVGALVCGILALVSGLLGFFVLTVPLAFILGIVAVVLGILGVRRAAVIATGRGQSISGIVTGAVGLVAALGWVLLFAAGWSALMAEFGDFESFMERVEEMEDIEDMEELEEME